MSAMEQNRLKEQIEGIKTQRLQVQLQIEQEGLRADRIKLQRTQVRTQIEQVGLQNDQLKLNQANLTNQIDQIKVGKLQDQVSFEQTDRMLQQRSYIGTLQNKEIQVAKIFEQARHEAAMLYGGSGSALPGR